MPHRALVGQQHHPIKALSGCPLCPLYEIWAAPHGWSPLPHGYWHTITVGRYVFSAKAPEDWRSPKAVANCEGSGQREASWTPPVLWRFLTGTMALNTHVWREGVPPALT